MKKYLTLCVLVTIIMLVLPMVGLKKDEVQKVDKTDKLTQTEQITKYQPQETDKTNLYKVLISSTGEVVELSEFDYIKGVLFAEMPPQYDIQALKAQAVVCYTYAYVRKENETANPSEDLKGAYISDNASKYQGYMSDEQAKEKWGEDFNDYNEKISQAVNDVLGQLVLYNSKPIVTAYHCISAGQTEDAQVLWGEEIPYLKSVTSSGDLLSPEYKTQVTVSKAEFVEITDVLEGVTLGNDSTMWVGTPKTSQAGTVLSIPIGPTEQSGQTIKELFGLRSANFNIVYKDGNFTFTVYGYGHNAGMSQYGADYMARQGDTYVDIIKHYYTGVEIKHINELL